MVSPAPTATAVQQAEHATKKWSREFRAVAQMNGDRRWSSKCRISRALARASPKSRLANCDSRPARKLPVASRSVRFDRIASREMVSQLR